MDVDDFPPEIVVGVDFGMTCTGVAYSRAPDWPAPRNILNWPGRLPSELITKVPTQISYHRGGSKVECWGFECEATVEDRDIKEWFKLSLDPAFRDDSPDAPTRKEALVWFGDYIYCVYQYVVSHLAAIIPRFTSQRVEFIFSVPTTWKDPRIASELKDRIRLDASNHTAKIGLTEAEAAAVYASKEHYRKDDVILVCDSGGGTTDINILKLVSSGGQSFELKALDFVEGQPIGSVSIDKEVFGLIKPKLDKIQPYLSTSSETTAWKMISGRFEALKCAFGLETIHVPLWNLDIPSFSRTNNFPEAEIYNGQISIGYDQVKRFFDNNINKIITLIDGQIQRIGRQHPGEQISYLVLSGGFGSSEYVKTCLKNRYEISSAMGNAQNLRVLSVDKPQLAVVNGLVMDRVQQIRRGYGAIRSRCCRMSFGIIFEEWYNKELHTGESIRKDGRDGKIYAINQIRWLIKQGEPVPGEGLVQLFSRKIDAKDRYKIWKTQVVMSSLPTERLPRSMRQPGAKLVCNIDAKMDGMSLVPKNDRWYSRKRPYWLATFEVRVIIGPADLQFELRNPDTGNRIQNGQHDLIPVRWEPIAAALN